MEIEKLIFGVIGIVAMVSTYVLFWRMGLYGKEPRDRKMEKAVRLGNYAEAKRIRVSYSGYFEDGDNTAKYEFFIDGKRYEHRFVDRSNPPETLTVYWINRPSRSFNVIKITRKDAAYGCLLTFLPLLVGALTVMIAAKIMGISLQ